ncbi:hypothetical protein B0J11DRAFT_257883 [Dendryphion nanum]|uniref:Uncharacterized protein n=1 Tax=Dendryphion nanum TaxID=256645 RepID=A0A9P9ITR7_9PLEO|nr:hypothetical protein B0J11DRAFT_257883 [Dendryphion nanum]
MSRGLSFYTYQSSQEIIYQEHLAKNLADNFAGLNQQMDQLIHDANAQIKLLQDKLQAIHVDQTSLEQKNHELVDVLREKSRAHQQAQKLYQSLKAQVMASQVVTAASDAADLTLHSARGDRYVGRIPGVQTMAGNSSQPGMNEHMARKGRHERNESVSSGSVGQRRGGIGVGPAWNSQLQSHGLGNRAYSGHQLGAGNGASQSQPRSRLPVLGSTRANPFPATETGNGYQGSPMTRLPVGISPRPVGGYALGAKSKSTGAYLGR